MSLQGQERSTENGFAMAALLVGLSIAAVLMTMAVPLWKTAVKREKEAELMWRGSQYARAVALFRRKYANASPPNLDILLNERFLRRKYKDPFTKDGEFQLIYAADQQQRPGPQTQNPGSANPPAPNPLDQRTQGPAGARGGIIGVVSKSKDTSLRLFNGRSKYNEWTFTPETVPGLAALGGGNAPGRNQPGTRPGGPAGVGPGGSTNRPGTGPQGGGFPRQPPGQRPFGLPQRPPD